jgi:hypothetical protein
MLGLGFALLIEIEAMLIAAAIYPLIFQRKGAN